MNVGLGRLAQAILTGVVVGLVTLFLIILVKRVVPEVTIDEVTWGLVVGVLAGVVSYLNGNNTNKI